MLVDYGKNRWEFTTEEAVFVAKDLIRSLKASYGVDVTIPETKTEAADETVTESIVKDELTDNE